MLDSKYRISDQLWKQIEPLLLPGSPELKSGCPYIGKREAMEAVLYMLRIRGDLRDMEAEKGD